MAKISPHLWYTDKADEAAAFYASIFPDARVDSVTAIEADTLTTLRYKGNTFSLAPFEIRYFAT